ncbi:MAG: type II toxin-antitoxin system RelB/DinJ family antitoxin [Lachnospiraceae bacterium]|nr:type II toxin-antitoxin system RelB/DinJ family antitoxin [Lachnospiraceae bacterium]
MAEKVKKDKTAVNFLMESKLKSDWEEILDELGFSISGVIGILARQMVRDRKLPFTPDASEPKSDVNLEIELQKKESDMTHLLEYAKFLQKNNK